MTTVRLTCPCGHTWDHPRGEPLPTDLRSICPACTLAAQNTLDPSSKSGSSANSSGIGIITAPPPPPPARASIVPASGTFIQTPTQQSHSAAASVAIAPGSIIAGFEIHEELNRGGMGVIYKARQLVMNRLVAFKAIIPAKLERPGVRERFDAEVKASALLNHPNIVNVYDADLDGPCPYLAMEYVPGVDLLRLVRKGGPLPVSDAVYYIRQAAEGLQHAHERGLIHRDVKPSNLMVSPGPITPESLKAGKLPKIKILDMGLARVIPPEGIGSTADLTEPGIFLGTPDYVSPEQAEDSQHADARSDLYSLGGALYFLLTGEVPFPGKTLVEKIRKAITEAPPTAGAKRKDVPPGLDAIIRKMLAVDPNDRYQTGSEVVQALDRILRGEGGPLATGTPVFAEREAPTPQTHVHAHEGGIRGLAITPDGQTLITAGEDSRLRLWSPAKLQEIRTILGDFGAIEGMALAANGKRVATCATRLTTSEMGVQLWDLSSGAEQKRLRGPAANVRSVAISQDSKAIAAGADDSMVWIWMADAGGPKTFCMKGHAGSVTGIWFVASESLLTAGADGTVRQWDSRTGKLKGTLPAGAGPLVALAFGGKRVAAAGETLAVRQPSGTFVKFSGHSGNVLSVAFSPDGRLLASGVQDKTLRVWSTEEAKELIAYPHASPVRSVIFAQDGRALFTGDQNGVLSRWNVPVI
ncbi:MAG TPA: serine/threonine-protein kinase [Gemmata sp.]|nr:serine/threonine-protein kinase [Gemmata sp.]